MRLLLIPVLCCTLALAACGRPSITFAFGPADEPLQETAVIDEGGDAKIAQIDVRGLIADNRRTGLFGNGTNPVDDLVARLEKAGKDPQVRAVLLRINSPGGTVAGSEAMYREVRHFRTTTNKPVIVSMGEVAASGGYYLAMAGDEVIAQPSTITGSIGVIIPTVNFSDGLRRIGITARSIKSGANKDLANPLEPIREEQYAVLQHMVDEFYTEFRTLVLERRAHHPEVAARADDLMDGRVFTGREAAAVGLVDSTGDLRDAFARAKSLAKLEKAQLIRYHVSGEKPRSAYASTDVPAPAAAPGVEVNILNIESAESLMNLAGSRPYYLWMP
jgi:protease-4